MRDTAYFTTMGRFIYACVRLEALLEAAPAALPASVRAVQAELAAQLAQVVDGRLQPTQEELDALTAQVQAAIRAAQAAG